MARFLLWMLVEEVRCPDNGQALAVHVGLRYIYQHALQEPGYCLGT